LRKKDQTENDPKAISQFEYLSVFGEKEFDMVGELCKALYNVFQGNDMQGFYSFNNNYDFEICQRLLTELNYTPNRIKEIALNYYARQEEMGRLPFKKAFIIE
jgi:hypothetical protein